MEFIKLTAKLRTATGKGPSRRFRASGHVPAVIYGKGIETTSILVEPKELTQALSGPLRINTVLSIEVDGAPAGLPKEIHAIVRDHQYHPVKRTLRHVDFLTVDPNTPISVSVPVRREGRSVGEQLGGILTVVYRNLQVECLPAAIPAEIVLDVSKLEVGDTLDVSDMELPEGVTCGLPQEASLITVSAPKKEEEKTDEEGEEGEGAEGAAEGEEAKAEDAEKKE